MKNFLLKNIGRFLNLTAPLFPKWNGDYGFKLLCKVKRIGVSAEGKQFFAKGDIQFLDIANQKIALHKWGTGNKKILFVHGWMSNAQRWQPYVDDLDLSEYTAYALDAQGHGMSDGDALNLEVYRQAVSKSIGIIGDIHVLVGHSLGSLVNAYTYLVNSNLPIKRFVIMGSPSGMDAIFTYFQDMLSLSDRTLENLRKKVNTVLRLPAKDLSIANFFKTVTQTTLVIHETTDTVTPIHPITLGIEANPTLQTYFTQGYGHNLEDQSVVERVLHFITQSEKEKEPQLQN